MFCTTCGGNVPAGASFCAACGAPFAPAERSEFKKRTLLFHGDGGALLGIYLVNAVLTVCTVGVYYFWGKVKVRRYLFGQTDFDGDRFEFHGTGGELLKAWLKIMTIVFLLALPAAIAQAAFRSVWAGIAVYLFLYAVVLGVTPVAIVGAARYRLSRTSWRNIRFSFRGKTGEFVILFVRGVMLTIITLGFYSPYFLNDIRQFLIGHSRFGTEFFRYDGEGKDLFPRYVRAFFLSLITLGIYWFWWRAERDRYYWDHTSFGSLRFRSSLTGGGLVRLGFTNLLIVVFTLGIGIPWAEIRQLRYRYDTLSIEGLYDWARIQQQWEAASASGEGIADVLDIDIDLGI